VLEKGGTVRGMNTITNDEFDLIVIGGGPAGSTVATLSAMQGHRVLILEREKFPRYQIGESLLPSTVHGICRLLGVSEELKRQNFPVKRGGTFRWGRREQPWTFNFSKAADSPTGWAYQVERMRFDSILLNNARAKGVDVREEHLATEIIFNNDRAIGVVYTDAGGRERAATARYIIDSGGNRSSFHKHCGQRIYSEFFQNIAIHCYYEGGKRLPPPDSGNILTVASRHGWLWYIPLSRALTSVGAVVSRAAAKQIQVDREAAMYDFVSQAPLIKELLKDAKRVTSGPYGIIRVRNDYSYCNTRFWRPGIALIGDAACFVDPLFSSGVHLGTYSALLAARSINTCLRENSISEQICFEEFENRYRREFGNFYQFLVGFYDMQVDEDSYFWAARKIVATSERENVAFVRLVSGLSAVDEPIFGEGHEFFESRVGFGEWFENEITASPRVPSPSDLDDTKRHRPHFDAEKFMEGFTSEILQVQMLAMFGEDREPEQPLFPDGLVPSSDGLHWTIGIT
jgi:halogenation protein CepH